MTQSAIHIVPTAQRYEELACPCCTSTTFKRVAYEGETWVVRCTCGLMYVNPQLRSGDRPYWSDYERLRIKYADIFAGVKAHPRTPNYREHVSVLSRRKPGHVDVLDIGSHCGFFMAVARELSNWKVIGIEPSAGKTQLAREMFGHTIHQGYLADARLPTASFDIVTLVDVFEHIALPLPLLTEIRRVLKDDGVVFIKVPQGSYNLLKHRLLRRLFRSKIEIVFDTKEHVMQYTPTSLKKTLKRAGFRIERFYVPRPIQSGSRVSKILRHCLYLMARVQFALTGSYPGYAPDIAVLVVKNRTENMKRA